MKTFTVTLTLEIPAKSREALQQIIDTVTTYDLIDMARCISDVIEDEKPEQCGNPACGPNCLHVMLPSLKEQANAWNAANPPKA